MLNCFVTRKVRLVPLAMRTRDTVSLTLLFPALFLQFSLALCLRVSGGAFPLDFHAGLVSGQTFPVKGEAGLVILASLPHNLSS